MPFEIVTYLCHVRRIALAPVFSVRLPYGLEALTLE